MELPVSLLGSAAGEGDYELIHTIMPEISRFYGIIIYMYISDHQPPHFHVVYNEYECWITIKDGIITGTLPRRAARLVFEWLDLHEKELLENWERLQNSLQPQKIDPLK